MDENSTKQDLIINKMLAEGKIRCEADHYPIVQIRMLPNEKATASVEHVDSIGLSSKIKTIIEKDDMVEDIIKVIKESIPCVIVDDGWNLRIMKLINTNKN